MEDGLVNTSDVGRFFRQNPDPTPWFTEYRTAMNRALGCVPHEFTEQPIGMLVVVAPGETPSTVDAVGEVA
jgi:hypothetical protein